MKRENIIFIVVLTLLLAIGCFGFWFWKNIKNTNTVSKAKISKCLIVPDKYCKLLKTEEEISGLLKITADLPDKTQLFSPIDGDCIDGFTKYNLNGEKTFGAMIRKNDFTNNKTIDYIFSLDKSYRCLSPEVKKGDYIGQINYDTNKDFVFTIQSVKKDNNYSYTDSEIKVEILEINNLIKNLINNK